MNKISRNARSVDRHIPAFTMLGALVSLSSVSVSAQQMNRADLKSPSAAQIPRASSNIAAVAPTPIPDLLRPDRFTPQLVSLTQAKTAVFVPVDQLPPVPSGAGQMAAIVDPLAGRLRPDQATKIERVQAQTVPVAAPQASQIK